MANRIDKLRTKATDLVENKNSFDKQLSELKVDESVVSELSATIQDDSDTLCYIIKRGLLIIC